jgi:hypothetical protein
VMRLRTVSLFVVFRFVPRGGQVHCFARV